MWMLKLGFTLVAMLLFFGCDGSPQAADESGSFCHLPNWHLGEAQPPSRVLVWELELGQGAWQLNGKRSVRDDVLQRLGKTRDYRPSPYLMLTDSGEMSCGDLGKVAVDVDKVFDCKTNYCFYIRRPAQGKSRQ